MLPQENSVSAALFPLEQVQIKAGIIQDDWIRFNVNRQNLSAYLSSKNAWGLRVTSLLTVGYDISAIRHGTARTHRNRKKA